MADAGATPPPKDVVTTRTPTPTTPATDRPESKVEETDTENAPKSSPTPAADTQIAQEPVTDGAIAGASKIAAEEGRCVKSILFWKKL